MQRWSKHPRWPWGSDARKWPKDVSKIVAWRDQNLSLGRGRGAMQVDVGGGEEGNIGGGSGAVSASTARAVEVLLKAERRKLVQLQREILEGKYVSKDHYLRSMVGIVLQFKHGLQEIQRRVPAVCAGSDGPTIDREIADVSETILNRIVSEGQRLASVEEAAAFVAGGKNPIKSAAAARRHGR